MSYFPCKAEFQLSCPEAQGPCRKWGEKVATWHDSSYLKKKNWLTMTFVL